MTVTDPLAGRLLDRRYRVGPRIARGGMATVYRATDTRLDREVALKVMHPGLAGDADFVRRFVREARCAAALSHPNVVAVHDQGEADDTFFLVMEYVPGHTLRDVVRAHPAGMPPAQALDLLEPVVSALAAAHATGFVHRDIKPENVLITNGGAVKVADFGLVRAVSAAAPSTASGGLLIGSVSYLAPELVIAGAADARCDVYAVGILGWELLTGRKPHPGESPLEVAYQHVHTDVPPPSRAVGGIPACLDALVLSAAARRPADRPADAGVLLEQLRRVRSAVASPGVDEDRRSTEPTLLVQRAEPPPPPATPRRTGHRIVLALVAALLAAAVGAGGWYYTEGRFTTTPPVLREPLGAAAEAIRAAGLSFRVSERDWSQTVPEGSVISTDPGPGERVLDSGVVKAVVSKGPHLFGVPRITGLPRNKAVAALAKRHLRLVDTRVRFSELVPNGTTIAVRPRPGTPLRAGSGVVLTVSAGPRPIEIPDVRGKDATSARSRLSSLGFDVVSGQRHSGTVPAGTVIAQRPFAGTGHRGDRVALVVSSGPALVTVPDVRNFGVDAAKAALHQAGFRVDVQAYELASFGLGFVVEQRPGANSMAPRGSTVIVYLV